MIFKVIEEEESEGEDELDELLKGMRKGQSRTNGFNEQKLGFPDVFRFYTAAEESMVLTGEVGGTDAENLKKSAEDQLEKSSDPKNKSTAPTAISRSQKEGMKEGKDTDILTEVI
jgi:hypothetical protein